MQQEDDEIDKNFRSNHLFLYVDNFFLKFFFKYRPITKESQFLKNVTFYAHSS